MLARLRRSSLAALVAALAWTGSVQAAGIIRITEAMSSGDSVNGVATDWFEVTNVGDAAVNISGYKVDDSSYASAAALALNGITSIAPGESVIFLEGTSTTVTTFKTNWALGSPTQVGYYAGSGIGLSSGGDGVTMFDAAGSELSGPTAGKIRLSFGAATTS